MRWRFSPKELSAGRTELSPPLSFTKSCPVLRIRCESPALNITHPDVRRNLLFDLRTDPHEQHPLNDPAVEQQMLGHLTRLMHAAAAPPEQFERLGLRP
jgi:hypothetical protein